MGDKVEPRREFIEKHAHDVEIGVLGLSDMVFYKLVVIFHKLVGQDLQSCCHGFWIVRHDGRQSRTASRVYREARVAGWKRRFIDAGD